MVLKYSPTEAQDTHQKVNRVCISHAWILHMLKVRKAESLTPGQPSTEDKSNSTKLATIDFYEQSLKAPA